MRLRLEWRAGGRCRFGAAFDGGDPVYFEPSFVARPGRWVGAKVGLFATTPAGQATEAAAEFAWFRVAPLSR